MGYLIAALCACALVLYAAFSYNRVMPIEQACAERGGVIVSEYRSGRAVCVRPLEK